MALVPLFPLPNVVLFPGVPLPLHIFEPRYRAMTADALEGDRRIVMGLLRPGWDADYEGRPPVFPVGCTGVIAKAVRHDDGRYHLILQGLERVRIVDEDQSRSYRLARIEPMPDPALDEEARDALTPLRRRLLELAGLDATEGEAAEATATLTSMPDTEFVHALAHGLSLDALEKQALLERIDLLDRARALAELLEMRRLSGTMPPASRRSH